MPDFDHSSHNQFTEFYANKSSRPEVVARCIGLRDTLSAAHGSKGIDRGLDVLDVGCNAGAHSMVWAEAGHRVCGLDINEPLLTIARERAANANLTIDYRLGSATDVPWPDASFDVCAAPELLEHVENWKRCLDEFARVLRPGGVLYLSTTNWLCPIQQEFNLPLYSWYPPRLKRHYEHLAKTSQPELANYATYPALHWFSFYSLRSALATRGMRSLDRFDTAALRPSKRLPKRLILSLVRAAGPLRFLGHLASPGTQIIGIKHLET